MAITHSKSKRKSTGNRYKAYRKKKLYETGRPASLTKVGALKQRTVRVMGGNRKYRIVSAEFANVVDPKTKKFSKSKIKNVVESTANKHYIRRNIIVKGSVIETEAGKAKVSSRPGQDGSVNAVLV